MTSFPSCLLWRACCSAKKWKNVSNSGVSQLLVPQNMRDPLEGKIFWIKTQDLSSQNLSVGFCLCDLVQIIKYRSWEMYLRAFHRCWGLCSLYFTFSVLSGPAAIEPSEESGVLFYTSLWRQNDFHFQRDRDVNCYSKLCSKEPKPLIMKNLGNPGFGRNPCFAHPGGLGFFLKPLHFETRPIWRKIVCCLQVLQPVTDTGRLKNRSTNCY